MTISPLHGTKLALALSALVLLGACADEQEAPDASTATSSTTAESTGFINPAGCSAPAKGKVSFKIGDLVLDVPGGEVEEAIPTGLAPPLDRDKVRAKLAELSGAGKGCPGDPINTNLLLIQADLGHALLDGRIGILRTPDTVLTERFATLTRGLRENPNENCRGLGPDLIGCVGTETRGERETPVMYVISRDESQKMATGGPLAVRCVLKGGAVQGCNLVDRVGQQAVLDAGLNAGNYSSDELARAYAAVIEKITTLSP